MAQGSIVWRCRICGNKSSGHCAHPKGSYSIVYYVGTRQKWMQVGRNRRDAERKLVAVLAGVNNGTYRELELYSNVVDGHERTGVSLVGKLETRRVGCTPQPGGYAHGAGYAITR